MEGVFLTYQDLFKKLLDFHEVKGYLRNKRVKKILGEIDLEIIFNEEQIIQFLLFDSPVLFYYRNEEISRTVSAPHMISMIISMLDLKMEDKVLILGSKGGLLETAVAKSVSQVFILEQHDEIAAFTEEAFIKLGLKNIWIRRGNPYEGLENEGPFTKILITGAIPFVPSKLLDQLTVDGIMVLPIMVFHPNHQIILQICKKKKEIVILNYGSVIFSSLFANEVPKIDKDQDLTIQKVIKLNPNIKQPNILNLIDFFSNHKILPNLIVNNIYFSKNENISQKFVKKTNSKIKGKNLTKSEIEERLNISMSIDIVIFNPYKIPIDIYLNLKFPFLNHNEKKEKIILNPENNTNITFPLRLPFQECQYSLNLIATTMESYQIFSQSIKLNINEFIDGWIATLEL